MFPENKNDYTEAPWTDTNGKGWLYNPAKNRWSPVPAPGASGTPVVVQGKVPEGGTYRKLLRKRSGIDYDLEWTGVMPPSNAGMRGSVLTLISPSSLGVEPDGHVGWLPPATPKVMPVGFDPNSPVPADTVRITGHPAAEGCYYKTDLYLSEDEDDPREVWAQLGHQLSLLLDENNATAGLAGTGVALFFDNLLHFEQGWSVISFVDGVPQYNAMPVPIVYERFGAGSPPGGFWRYPWLVPEDGWYSVVQDSFSEGSYQNGAILMTVEQYSGIYPGRQGERLHVQQQSGDPIIYEFSEFSGNWIRVSAFPQEAPPPAPVTSVNNQTGDVNLTAADVGAAEADHNHDSAYVAKDESDNAIVNGTFTAYGDAMIYGGNNRMPNQVVSESGSVMTRVETSRNYIRRFFNSRNIAGSISYHKGGATSSFPNGAYVMGTASAVASNIRHNRVLARSDLDFFERSSSNGTPIPVPSSFTMSFPLSQYRLGAVWYKMNPGTIVAGSFTSVSADAPTDNHVGMYVTGGYPKKATWDAGGTQITLISIHPLRGLGVDADATLRTGVGVGMAVVGPFFPVDTVITAVDGDVVTVNNPALVSSESCGGDIAFSPYPSGTNTVARNSTTITFSAPALITLGGSQSCAFSNGSTTVTPTSLVGLYAGQGVTGTGIQSSTFIDSINSAAGTITLTKATTQAGPQTLNFNPTGDTHRYRLLYYTPAVVRLLASVFMPNQYHDHVAEYPWCEIAMAFNGIHGDSFITGVNGWNAITVTSSALACAITGTATGGGAVFVRTGGDNYAAPFNGINCQNGYSGKVWPTKSVTYNLTTTVTMADTTGIVAGMLVWGSGINSTTPSTFVSVVSVDSPTQITISANATLNASGQTMYYGWPSRVPVAHVRLPAGTEAVSYSGNNLTVSQNFTSDAIAGTALAYVPAGQNSPFSNTLADCVARACSGIDAGLQYVTVSNTDRLFVGMRVSSAGGLGTPLIPLNTFIVNIVGTTVYMSKNPTASPGTATLYFGGRVVHGPGIQPGTVALAVSGQAGVTKSFTANGTAVLTLASGDMTGLEPGMRVEASAGVTAGTYIIAMGPNSNQVTVSANVTAGTRDMAFGATFRVELSAPLSYPAGMRCGYDNSVRGFHQGLLGVSWSSGRCVASSGLGITGNGPYHGLCLALTGHPSTGLDCVVVEEDVDGVLRLSPYLLTPAVANGLPYWFFSANGTYAYSYACLGRLRHAVLDYASGAASGSDRIRVWFANSYPTTDLWWPVLTQEPQITYVMPEALTALRSSMRGWAMGLCYNGTPFFARGGDLNFQATILSPGIGYYPLETFTA